MIEWQQREILIAVKAYPNPEEEYGEGCCTAGVDREGRWLRIWPVPFRDLAPKQRFKKWQWIRAVIRKSADPRPESHEVQPDTIECLETVATEGSWAERAALIERHFLPSLEELKTQQEAGTRTMAYVRPKEILSFEIEARPRAKWTEREAGLIGRLSLFSKPKAPLERIPFKFYYRFRCADTRCGTHRLQVIDWEIHESYRSWLRDYGPKWEEALRQKYEQELPSRDLCFNLGNYIKYPTSFGICALYYPPRG